MSQHTPPSAQNGSDGTPNPPESGPRPPTEWRPASIADTGRASFASNNGHSPATQAPTSSTAPQIDGFKAPRPWWPLLALLIAVLAGAAILYTTTLGRASSETKTSSTPRPTATTSADGQPFANDDSSITGTWRIVEHRWTDSGLDLLIRLHVTAGELDYSFMAFTNTSTQVLEPVTTTRSPALISGTMAAGETRSGWVSFAITRQTSTVLLTSEYHEQLSALEVAS